MKAIRASSHLAFLREWCRATISSNWVPKRNVAASYALGEGVKKNEAKARLWYARAVSAGDQSANYDLGLMLINGEGGPQEPERGRLLVLEAASGGDGMAQKLLADAYEHGYLSFPVDPTQAEYWKQKALEQGLAV